MTDMVENYFAFVRSIAQSHKRLMAFIQMSLDRAGKRDINASQALLLFNIGEESFQVMELARRGYYTGTNISHAIRKLVDHGYVTQKRCEHDKRTMSISNTYKGLEIADTVRQQHTLIFEELCDDTLSEGRLTEAHLVLRQIRIAWNDHLDGN